MKAGRPLLKTGAIKMFADGVIESRTAAVLERYANQDTTGIPNYTLEDMNRIVAMMDERAGSLSANLSAACGDPRPPHRPS